MSRTERASLFDATVVSANRLESLADRVETTAERPTLDVRTPIEDELIGTVPAATTVDVAAAVDRARVAQSEWENRSIEDRGDVLRRFGDLVLERREWLLDLVQLETGKARVDALEEILDVPLTCSYYDSKGPSILAESKRAGAIPGLTDARVTTDPVGVAGVISPWNYPLTLAITDVIPALLAGNAVVCKPDERTPYIALAVAELFEEAGLPAGAFEVVTGDGSTVGPALIDHVDHVTFTGSTETGRAVAERAGRNLIGSSLELGGKNPMLVLNDADVETAARGAVEGAFTNAGQLCLAPERIYVADSRHEEFLDAFVDATRQLLLGVEFRYRPDVGSLIDGGHLERVQDYVADARADGASVRVGGRSRPDVGPFCYEPTILTDVDSDSLIVTEETFGPVVFVEPVSSAEEAIRRANDSPYGLNASVWTTDLARGRSVAREIDCGTVCVNDPYAVGWAAVDAPMGGFDDSGVGRRHGPEGLRRYVETRTIATSKIGPFGDPQRLPTRWYARAMTTVTRLQRRLVGWLS